MNLVRNILFFAGLSLMIGIKTSYASNPLALTIDSGNASSKSKILFFGFQSPEGELALDIEQITQMIEYNLLTTNLFELEFDKQNMEILLPGDTIYKNINDEQVEFNVVTSESVPNFEKYLKQDVSAIIVGEFGYDAIGNIEAKVRGWDVLDQKQLFGRYYTASSDNYNKIANFVSDEIFTKLTGEKYGHFNSKIAYIAESGAFYDRKKKLAVINFDGSKQRFLSDGSDLVLTPTFTKDNSAVFYLRYFLNKPHIFKANLRTGIGNKATGFRDSNFSPSIHPFDSNKLLLSATVNENTDIYEYDMRSNSSQRLTRSEAIDTTPSYSPDANKIAFTSDRDGRQQIYIIDFVDYSMYKITKNDASYSKPQWSPDGKYIAFTKIKGGEFHAGIMLPDGSSERLLASAYLLEGVKWSPNSRYLIYSKKREPYGIKSIPRLFIVDIVTGFEYEVPTPENEGAIDPDWIL